MELERSSEWMFEQVKNTAGLAMSTFKEKGDNVERDDIPEEDLERNAMKSNWTPPPHLANKWVTGGRRGGYE